MRSMANPRSSSNAATSSGSSQIHNRRTGIQVGALKRRQQNCRRVNDSIQCQEHGHQIDTAQKQRFEAHRNPSDASRCASAAHRCWLSPTTWA
ncbi:hypothetical protein CBM2609_A20030 [Cupriavidus taiwanensis]|nr:hypothetical protein CBM2604_A20029 [Cupriavidus taiwanensis]SOZ26369.1 hypothetical protein CBM2609_A20030 [Cupriavidus taiwanensis]SOZ45233.1 hypothetical protein CBM2610_A20019 [Cupriavidus taiwanensis]